MLSDGPLSLLWGLQGPESNTNPLRGPHLEKALGGYLIFLNQNLKKSLGRMIGGNMGLCVYGEKGLMVLWGYGGVTGLWGHGNSNIGFPKNHPLNPENNHNVPRA